MFANMQIGGYRYDEGVMWDGLEKLGLALVILVVTWLFAKAAKWAFAKLVDNVGFFRRDTASGDPIGVSLGKIVSLLIWLLGLLAVLQVFELNGVSAPVQTLLNEVMQFIPNIVGAALIFFIGALVARIVKQIVETAMMTINFDKWANKGGVQEVTGNTTISKTIATIVYVLIIIPVAIAALEALKISAVSVPAALMLQSIFDAIPRIIAAALVLGIGYVIAKWVGTMLREILPGLGVDRSLAALEILPASTTFSGIVSRVTQIAIVLFFAIMAARMLQFPEITLILNEILELGGRVIFGSIIIAVGFLIANLLAKIIGGAGESGMAATIVKSVTMILFAAMGLKFMGIADSIIEMAFGALVIGAAVAGALAFGLGGREAAARKLAEMENKSDKL